MNVHNAKFLGIGRHQPVGPWRMKTHSHSFHELILVIEGAQCVRIAGKETHAAEGDLLFYSAGVPHEEWTARGERIESYFVSFDWKDGPSGVPVHLKDRYGRIRLLMDWLSAETKSHTALTPELIGTLLCALIAQFIALWKRPEEGFVDAIRRHIRDNLTSAISLDELAAVAGMSKYHFLRRYRNLTGRTPMADVRMIRLESARDLVLSTSLPLKVIAEKAGLGDQYHMSRLFRRCMGYSPGSLRRHTLTAPESQEQ